jgi:hypothetical protein
MTRAHRSLWILTAVTILATGLVAQALAAPAGPGADILLAASALLLVASGALLIRVLAHLTHSQPVPPPRRRT